MITAYSMLRAAGMAKRPITNKLLELTIESRVAEGIDPFAIRALICRFAYEEPRRDQANETVGFLWVGDIPQHYRGEFLTAVIDLPGRPQVILKETRKTLNAGSKLGLGVASGLWDTVRASFGSLSPDVNPPV